jgi:hypothetical protein
MDWNWPCCAVRRALEALVSVGVLRGARWASSVSGSMADDMGTFFHPMSGPAVMPGSVRVPVVNWSLKLTCAVPVDRVSGACRKT